MICGSENHCAYIWRLIDDREAGKSEGAGGGGALATPSPINAKRKKNATYEYFEAHAQVVTATVFAPVHTWGAKGAGGDSVALVSASLDGEMKVFRSRRAPSSS